MDLPRSLREAGDGVVCEVAGGILRSSGMFWLLFPRRLVRRRGGGDAKGRRISTAASVVSLDGSMISPDKVV